MNFLLKRQKLKGGERMRHSRGEKSFHPVKSDKRKISNALKFYAASVSSADKGA